MCSLTYGRWNPPVSSHLADLEGVWNDLFSARDFILRLEAQLPASSRDYTLLDALTTAALTRYARSFTTGVRQRLDASKSEVLDSSELALHKQLLAVRDKHVAHPVNCFETHAIYVGFCPDDPSSAHATVVSTGTRTSIGVSLEDIVGLKVICEKWLNHVRELKVVEETNLLAYAQQLTPSQLLALPRGPVEPHDDPTRVRPRA